MEPIHPAKNQVMKQQHQKTSNYYDILEEDTDSAQSYSDEEVVSDDNEYSYISTNP